MNEWLDKAAQLLSAGEPGTLVTVAGVRGSAPREIGARMLVTRDATIGTIGGGQLEYQSTRIAWDLLRSDDLRSDDLRSDDRRADLVLRRFPLGADCGQCCGGVVDVLFEDLTAASERINALLQARDQGVPALLVTWPQDTGGLSRIVVTETGALPSFDGDDAAVTDTAVRALADGKARRIGSKSARFVLLEPLVASDFNIAVFGAGHVGTSTVAVLATLEASIRWIDNRAGLLPDKTPANVQTLCSSVPAREVAALPANSCFLVLTHSHPLDYEICRAVLARDDFAYLGLIGSRSKRRRFEKRFQAEEVTGFERLTCPIGIAGISGKKPAEIALAVAAQLLQLREASSHIVTSDKVRPISRHVR